MEHSCFWIQPRNSPAAVQLLPRKSICLLHTILLAVWHLCSHVSSILCGVPMGNICDAIGLTRREPVKIENTNANSSSSSGAGETKSPVVDAASPSSTPHVNSSHTMNTVEMKVAFAKKQSDHAAAAAAIEVLTGPRIRLLPHQHTLFCERKQRVCAAVGEQQEMEVLVLEGLHTPTPPFSWIRISDIDAFNTAVVNGTVGPANYIVLEQEHALNERGVPTHSIFEYVLTREDVGNYIGVQYEDKALVRINKSSTATVKKATKSKVEVEESKNGESTTAAAGVEDVAMDSDAAVRSTLDSMVNRVSLGDQEDKNNESADSQSLPSPPSQSAAQPASVQASDKQSEENAPNDANVDASAEVEVEVEVEAQPPLHRYLTLVSHGPVKPGPPRLTEFNISGSMQVGTMAVAEASYIGGYEGATEYWWMRISPEGKRTQVTEPCRVPYPATLTPLEDPAVLPVSSVAVPTTAAATPVPTDDSGALQMEAPAATSEAAETKAAKGASSSAVVDPRYYLLTADDVGCSLKVKCRPTRSDGVEGEIFTSTSSEEVTSA